MAYVAERTTSRQQALEAVHQRIDAELEIRFQLSSTCLTRGGQLIGYGNLDAGCPHRMADDELRDRLDDGEACKASKPHEA